MTERVVHLRNTYARSWCGRELRGVTWSRALDDFTCKVCQRTYAAWHTQEAPND